MNILFLYSSHSQIFFKVFMNILFLNWIYIKNKHISHYSFVCMVNFSNAKIYKSQEKDFFRKIWEKKIYFRYSWITREYFPSDEYYSYSYSQVLKFTNYSYSYLYKSCLRESIPIPICGKNNYLLITGLDMAVLAFSWHNAKKGSKPSYLEPY